VKLEDVRQFARRDWLAAERAKRDFWADRYHRSGPDAARRASTQLLEHARRVQPDFPSEIDRTDDLAHHLTMRDHLNRAARAFIRR
jgi:hypothetical protein